MLKILALAITFVMASLSLASASTLKEITEASYILYVNGESTCSGQFIDYKGTPMLLTAAHCVSADAKAIYSLLKPIFDDKLDVISGSFYLLKLSKKDSNEDVALFELADKTAKFSVVDVAPLDTVLESGDDLMISHFPLTITDYHLFTKALYNDIVNYPPLGPGLSYLITGGVVRGSSGGGLYSKIGKEYYLIGTLKGGKNDWINYFSTIKGVHGLID